MKLTDILNESQNSYKRMNIGEENEEKGMTNEEKREFLKAVSEYKKFGESIYRSGNLAEVYESIKNIVETAHKVTLEETGDWFDKVTVNRHMKSMNESFKVFSNTIKEVNTLQQRLESCYDEMGEVLGKYYEIKEGNEFGAARAKAIANGDSEFEVDGKKFPVKDVDKDDKENAEKFTKESVNEGYVKSMGFKAVSERIDGLTKSLDPNGILCRNISKQADNVKPEFKQMKKRIDEIEQIWGEVEYTIEMSNESVNEGKHDSMLDKLADMVKGVDFMNVGKELKKNGIKYSFSTSMIPMYKIDKLPIAIVNKKYAAGAEREVGDIAIGLMESIKEETSMKLKDLLSESFGLGNLPSDKLIKMKKTLKEIEEGEVVNESKYTIIDPKGNPAGTGTKDQANKRQKKLGGSKKGYFVVPAKKALKARRTLEKYKFDFKNAKLQDLMSDLYFEGVDESVNEGASTEEKRIVMMAIKKIAKYRNVPLNYAVGDVLRAAEELERDIEKGKVK
jgi:hypothetical protein